MSLDVYEERKWKKGIYHVIANQISVKVKKANRKKKLDELYKRCMCLYLSMNINNNLTDISLGNENKNMSEQLNSYVKAISDVDYFNNQFTKWKGTLNEIKSKLEKKFGEQKANVKDFFKVINLMENMINMQEDTVKRINAISQNISNKNESLLATGETEVISSPPKNLVTDFIADIDFEMNNNERFKQSADHHYYTEYVESSLNNLNLNKMSKELNDVISEIVNEINNYNESEIFLNSDNATSAGDLININVDGNNNHYNIFSQDNLNKSLVVNSTKFKNILQLQSPNSPRLNEIIFNINPKQLFYDSTQNTSKNETELKHYLEKLLKVESEKIDILPNYNYKKISGAEIDINKDIDEFTKSYFKIFPGVYFTDKAILDKMMLESEIDVYKTRHDKVTRDLEVLNLYNLKFESFTTIQKLILIWGLCNYGMNLNIVAEIPNIFTFSKSLQYDTDEVFVYLDKTLDQLNVDLLASNFDVVNPNSNNFHNKFDHYINNLDPPMLNSTHCNFYYNKKLHDYVKHNNKTNINNVDNSVGFPNVKIKNYVANYGKNIKDIKDNNSHITQTQNLSQGVNLISYSPIFKSPEVKKFMYKNLKDNVKRICDLVFENFYNNNTNSSYNYQTMSKISASTTNNNSNNKETMMKNLRNKPNLNTNLNKNDLIQQLSNTKVDFNVSDVAKNALESTKPNVRQDILEGVSFYSQHSIQKEWEHLRSPWYQNNTQFKPKFRKNSN
jgi:hypothetical protein